RLGARRRACRRAAHRSRHPHGRRAEEPLRGRQKARGKRQKSKIKDDSSCATPSNFCLLPFASCLLPFIFSSYVETYSRIPRDLSDRTTADGAAARAVRRARALRAAY